MKSISAERTVSSEVWFRVILRRNLDILNSFDFWPNCSKISATWWQAHTSVMTSHSERAKRIKKSYLLFFCSQSNFLENIYLNWKRKYISRITCIYWTQLQPCISVPMHFKPVLFKGQPYALPFFWNGRTFFEKSIYLKGLLTVTYTFWAR